MYAEQNEDRAKEKIYKQGHDVKCLVLCLSYVFFFSYFIFIFNINIEILWKEKHIFSGLYQKTIHIEKSTYISTENRRSFDVPPFDQLKRFE